MSVDIFETDSDWGPTAKLWEEAELLEALEQLKSIDDPFRDDIDIGLLRKSLLINGLPINSFLSYTSPQLYAGGFRGRLLPFPNETRFNVLISENDTYAIEDLPLFLNFQVGDDLLEEKDWNIIRLKLIFGNGFTGYGVMSDFDNDIYPDDRSPIVLPAKLEILLPTEIAAKKDYIDPL